ncbi:MAG: hypothetical protein KF757_06900 [Phycisphaeraceae bacterium]|nr:hypothetical protein [Phycisphaeraceae bacterium]MCW5763320.1 hypothetical protein [Phycisphaeraceae bacterium]
MPESHATPSAFRDQSPVGSGPYVVRQGECLLSIAEASGHFWQRIWNHRDNAPVRSARSDAMVILPGDRLVIPPIEPGEESGATEQRHRFRRKGVPAVLKLQMMRDGEPRAGEPYELELDSKLLEGQTDDEGRITITIEPGARAGLLRVGTDENKTIQMIELGHLAPHDTVLGTQQRLGSLGYYEGREDGQWSDALWRAINTFLTTSGLEPEDNVSHATLQKIRDAHGS